jgi:hypothetical protein
VQSAAQWCCAVRTPPAVKGHAVTSAESWGEWWAVNNSRISSSSMLQRAAAAGMQCCHGGRRGGSQWNDQQQPRTMEEARPCVRPRRPSGSSGDWRPNTAGIAVGSAE